MREGLTDLVAGGVEEVLESNDVAVAEPPHDLQLSVLCEGVRVCECVRV